MSVVPNKPSNRDPYQTLGLPHDATPTQIKVRYRKLALQYHPDRQTPNNASSSSDAVTDEKTNKFVEIAAAYAVLSDPVQKKEYDHLYKYGAFDGDNTANNKGVGNTSAKAGNYRYTENYSGGYYTTPQQPNNDASQQQQNAHAAFFRSMSTASQDSFFDDMIYSPSSSCRERKYFSGENGGGGANKKQKQPGIGFSFAPLGKHLSIHVPSRNEIMMGMARGERLHNFGTRVTFSTQKTEPPTSSNLNGTSSNCSPFLCAESYQSGTSKRFVSTTTRIARGRHRVVKRTATLHPDGKKEVVVEEDGVVRRRYVEDIIGKENGQGVCPEGNEIKSNQGNEGKENGCWYSDLIRGMQGVIRPCFAPCGPVLATVPEQDV